MDDEHLNQKALSDNSNTMLINSREYRKLTNILKRRQTLKKVPVYNSLPGLQALSSPLQYFLSVFIALHKASLFLWNSRFAHRTCSSSSRHVGYGRRIVWYRTCSWRTMLTGWQASAVSCVTSLMPSGMPRTTTTGTPLSSASFCRIRIRNESSDPRSRPSQGTGTCTPVPGTGTCTPVPGTGTGMSFTLWF